MRLRIIPNTQWVSSFTPDLERVRLNKLLQLLLSILDFVDRQLPLNNTHTHQSASDSDSDSDNDKNPHRQEQKTKTKGASHLRLESMNIINIHGLLELPTRHHGAGRFDAGFELRAGDVPVVAAERVDVADAVGVLVDFAVDCRPAESRAFGLGGCESGGGEEEEE